MAHVQTVTYRDEGKERVPDGFFHPSTHPRWGERMLFYYLTQPDRMIPEDIGYENRMAMVMGTCAIVRVIVMVPSHNYAANLSAR